MLVATYFLNMILTSKAMAAYIMFKQSPCRRSPTVRTRNPQGEGLRL